jgi:hypothetical protein
MLATTTLATTMMRVTGIAGECKEKGVLVSDGC